jgi:hypothetical protein
MKIGSPIRFLVIRDDLLANKSQPDTKGGSEGWAALAMRDGLLEGSVG